MVEEKIVNFETKMWRKMECSMRKQAKCCNRGQFGSSLWGVFKDSFSYLEWEPMFWCSLHSLICIVRWVNIKELDQFSFFNIMPAKNLVSWNVIISGYAQNCLVNESFYLFRKLVLTGGSFD